MINSIKQAIVNQIIKLYPNPTIYDEDIPQGFDTPCFLITVVEQGYTKGIGKNRSEISFDLSYFSDQPSTEIKGDCLLVQQELFRGFDLIGQYRCYDKKAQIEDNILHFMFKVKYSEIEITEGDNNIFNSISLGVKIKE